ncbi:MAG: ABC transporter permease subunit [Deltaproteobacteria bacterium]|nr:MAG: ABC transporter permease subunit [Deltaproteobacteria bacterium]
MSEVGAIVRVTFLGGIRDRTVFGIFILGLLLMLTVPIFSYFSMRQTTEVAAGYSLAVISVIGLLLTVFMGGNLISRDIDRKAIHTVVTLPISRTRYLLGKFIGLALLLLISLLILYLLAAVAVYFTSYQYPPSRPLQWETYLLVMISEYMMLLVISAMSVLFTSFATSTFLPMALTLAVYCIGQSTALVKDYLDKAPEAKQISSLVSFFAKGSYYIFPNLSAFDMKNAFVYSLPMDLQYLLTVLLYGLFYLSVVIFMATYFFSRRDLT